MKPKAGATSARSLGDLAYKLLLVLTVLSIGGIFLYWFYSVWRLECPVALGEADCFRNALCSPCERISGTARHLGREWARTLLPAYLAAVAIRTADYLVAWIKRRHNQRERNATWPSSDSRS